MVTVNKADVMHVYFYCLKKYQMKTFFRKIVQTLNMIVVVFEDSFAFIAKLAKFQARDILLVAIRVSEPLQNVVLDTGSYHNPIS